ncbi:murein DD-endopeptidase [Pseudomonas sp. TE3786]
MRFLPQTWLSICLCLPLTVAATHSVASNRYQPLPAHATGHTATSDASSSTSAHAATAANSEAAKNSSVVLGRAVNTLGVRYRWGGSSPEKGFDCSGLVRYAFDDIDSVDLSRTSNAMARTDGKKVARDALKPGDLLFFNIRGGRVNHVAIYLGNDRFIHAPRRGKAVTIDTLNKPYWKTRYALAKRVLPSTEPQLRVTTR